MPIMDDPRYVLDKKTNVFEDKHDWLTTHYPKRIELLAHALKVKMQREQGRDGKNMTYDAMLLLLSIPFLTPLNF